MFLDHSIAGTVVKILHLKPNNVKSVEDAIQLGKYFDYNKDIPKLFADCEVGLDEAVDIHLVEFNRGPSYYSELFAWATANEKKPMQAKHIFAIGIQHPNKDSSLIVEVGSTGHGDALCIYGNGFQNLSRYVVGGNWDRSHLFGFISEKPPST